MGNLEVAYYLAALGNLSLKGHKLKTCSLVDIF